MILRLLVRAHYEVTGDIKGFPFQSILDARASEEHISSSEVFFRELGYDWDESISAEERHRYIKMLVRKEYEPLMKVFKVKTRQELLKVMETMNCIGDKGLVTSLPENNTDIDQAARVLAEFLANNEEKVAWQDNFPILLSGYLRSLSLKRKKKELEEALSSPMMQKALYASLPQFTYAPGASTFISQNSMVLPRIFSQQEIMEMVNKAIRHVATRVLDVDPQIYFYLNGNAINYQKETHAYLRLLNWANIYGTTVEGLFERCGLHYPNKLEFYKTFKVFPFISGTDRYMFYTENSETEDQFIDMSAENFEKFLKSGDAKNVVWKGKTAEIEIDGELTPVSSMYFNIQK